jgi:hypothetical protein
MVTDILTNNLIHMILCATVASDREKLHTGRLWIAEAPMKGDDIENRNLHLVHGV